MEVSGVIDRYEDENTKMLAFENLQFAQFQFLLWSKVKFSEDCNESALIAQFKKRFEKSLPLNSINMIFVTGLDQPVQN